ncbi:MAG: hypothetical protein WBL05_07365, partial [Brooklawnia sp.]
MNPSRQVVLLDAYAAIRCPVKVQNYYDATIQLPEGASGYGVRGSSEAQQEYFADGREFVGGVQDVLARLAGAVDLRPLADEDPQVAQDATEDAVQA